MNVRTEHINELRKEQMWKFFLGVCSGTRGLGDFMKGDFTTLQHEEMVLY